MQRFKNFIRRIQRSEEETRYRWLIGLIIAVGLIIIPLWFFYVASKIPVLTGEVKKAESRNVFVTGVTTFFSEISRKINSFINPFSKTNDIMIQATPPNENQTPPSGEITTTTIIATTTSQ